MAADTESLVFTTVVLVLTTVACFVLWWKTSAPAPSTIGQVTSIVVYPLKSARGVSVDKWSLDARGLVFDRLWMAVDSRGAFLSQRRAPRLALVEASLPTSPDEPLRLHSSGAQPIEVPVVRSRAHRVEVRVWEDHVEAIDQGNDAARWLETVLKFPGARLVRMADDATRHCNRKYAPSSAQTALSDGFPLLLANEASLSELNDRIADRGGQPIPMERFRPNLVVGDAGSGRKLRPFDEDSWSEMGIKSHAGRGARFGVVKPCSRCKIPTIDQETGVPDRCTSNLPAADVDDEGGGPASEAEPTATLRTFRTGRLLGYARPKWAKDVFFGQNIVSYSQPGVTIAVGDEVVATLRRPPSWLAWGVRGVHYTLGE